MIVRDEEQVLGRCLESVRGLVNEIIVVDTGSVDRTREIAREHGAQVFEEAWPNDFGAARNISLQKAAGDWILVLDADEAIDSSDHERIRNLLSDRRKCYSLTQRHYTNKLHLSNFRPACGEFPKWEEGVAGYFESSLVRLFPNRKGLEFRGVVHELVEHSIAEKRKLKIVNPGIRIHHYGHLLTETREKKKHGLYTKLGEEKTKLQPQSWKVFFEMAVQCQVNRDFEPAVEHFRRSLELLPDNVAAWTNLGYVLGEMGRLEEAKDAFKRAIELNPKAYEAWCNLGVMFLRMADYPYAAQALMRAVEINREHANSWANLGEVFVQLNMLDQAAKAFNVVLELLPNNPRALEGLANCYMTFGDMKEAERLLKEVVKREPTRGKPYYSLAQICRLTDRAREAVDLFQKFCEVEKKRANHNPEFVRQARVEAATLRRAL